MRLKPKLIGLHQSNSGNGNYLTTDYYQVPFVDVMTLVAKREVYVEAGLAYVSRSKILSIVEGKFRMSLSRSLTHAYQMKFRWASDTRIASIVNKLSKVAFQYGGSTSTSLVGRDGALHNNLSNPSRVVQIFVDYLTTVMGHSDPKMKPAGVNKLYVSVGTKRPNCQDKTCPIANRIHKSNSQKYTIFFDTFVMEQGCWDGICQATGRHVYYQIQADGRCRKVGWTPPPLDTTMIAKMQAGQMETSSEETTQTTSSVANKKMKLSPPPSDKNNKSSMQVSP